MATMPAAEAPINVSLVAALVVDQCPEFAGQVEPFGNGWDNAVFSLGDNLLVRLPRREAAVPLLRHEIDWLATIAQAVEAPLPVPVFVGRPGHGYPWSWTIVPRLPGRTAVHVTAAERRPAARGLARFFARLHRPAPANAPVNPFRGTPLDCRRESWEPRIRTVAGEAAWRQWTVWADGSPWPGPPVWLHGDPHPLNLLLAEDGNLVGVIDWGDICSGDPASDLADAWLVFDEPGREQFMAACGPYDSAVWQRAQAWALGLACTFAASSDDQPDLAAISSHTLTQLGL